MIKQQAIYVMQKYTNSDTISRVVQEAHELAIAALEKQIPKKPEKVQKLNDGRKVGWCPTCKYAQNYENWNCCHDCGQALDWGDE